MSDEPTATPHQPDQPETYHQSTDSHPTMEPDTVVEETVTTLPPPAPESDPVLVESVPAPTREQPVAESVVHVAENAESPATVSAYTQVESAPAPIAESVVVGSAVVESAVVESAVVVVANGLEPLPAATSASADPASAPAPVAESAESAVVVMANGAEPPPAAASASATVEPDLAPVVESAVVVVANGLEPPPAAASASADPASDPAPIAETAVAESVVVVMANAEESPATPAVEQPATEPVVDVIDSGEPFPALEATPAPTGAELPVPFVPQTSGCGCAGRTGTIAISVVISMFSILFLMFLMGFRPGEVAALREENALLQTQVTGMDGRVGALRGTVEAEIIANDAAIATIEADQFAQANQIILLEGHSERLDSFLAMLGELANRTAAGEDPRDSTSWRTAPATRTPPAGQATAEVEEATSTSVTDMGKVMLPLPTSTPTPNRVSR